jgi:DNA/RNA endonuclease G (NUC1)
LYGKNVNHPAGPRTTFHGDNLEPIEYQSNAAIYNASGYDKGHLSPDDDFRFNIAGESESMVYTNCAPQVPSFNR